MKKLSLSLKLLLVVVPVTLAAGGLFLACGSDSGGPVGQACDGGGCEGDAALDGGSGGDGSASSDGSGPGTDGSVAADGGGDSATLMSCGDGGGGGTLDPTFGGGGFVVLASGVASNAYASIMQPDGKLLLGGYYNTSIAVGNKNFTVFRVTAKGTLDTAFADAGAAQTVISNGALGVKALALDASGRILSAGIVGGTPTHRVYGVTRHTGDGALDTTFGNAGVAQIDFVREAYDVASLAVLPDGRILVSGDVGDASSAVGTDYAVARLTANGLLDTTFGTGGKTTLDVRSSEDAPGVMAVQPDGKIMLAGLSSEEPARLRWDLSAVRFNGDGTLDTTFAAGGKFVTAYGPSSAIRAWSVAIDSAGRIVLAGQLRSAPTYDDFALVRLTPAGALDPTFGGTGLVTTDFAGADDDGVWLFVQPDGKLLVAGGTFALDRKSGSLAVARYQSNGALDPTFGTSGKVVTAFPGSPLPPGSTASLQGCSLTIAGGIATPGGTSIGATRYRVD